jgi:flagellar biosynthesis/type III secretory pathway M-ring protein FliF/YscJ
VEFVLVLAVVAVVAFVVSAPLRAGRAAGERAEESAEHAELTAAREAKYREIRDAELDHRTGKLSEVDWRVQDRALRAQAIEILRRLDVLEGREAE